MKLEEIREGKEDKKVSSLYSCSFCSETFFPAQRAKYHEKMHHIGNSVANCEYCGIQYKKGRRLQDHQFREHPWSLGKRLRESLWGRWAFRTVLRLRKTGWCWEGRTGERDEHAHRTLLWDGGTCAWGCALGALRYWSIQWLICIPSTLFAMNAGLTGHVSMCKTGVHSRKSAGGPVYRNDRPSLYETYTRMKLTDYST